MAKASSYWAAYFIPLSLTVGYLFLGAWLWLPFAFSFIILPIIDHFGGREEANPTLEQEEELRNDSSYNWPLYFYPVVQLGLVLAGAYIFSTQDLKIYESLGLIVSTSVATGGIGITIAHELCHRASKMAKAMGYFILALVGYAHFAIEHVFGHHFRVATPEDPASARFGENVYWFVPRSVYGSVRSVFEFEKKRLRKKQQSVFSLQNRLIWCFLAPVGAAMALYQIMGIWALAFFVAQALGAIFLLEVINFVEHYGLQRKRKPNGKYERVTPLHSWNANQRISNLFLFKLQRHADHHAHAARPYQILRHFEESPQLPCGYPTMILFALVPPLWRWVMDPRVLRIRSHAIESYGQASD